MDFSFPNFSNNENMENKRNCYLESRKTAFSKLLKYGSYDECEKAINNSNDNYRYKVLLYYAIRDAYEAYINNEELHPENKDKYSRTNQKWTDLDKSYVSFETFYKAIRPLIAKAKDRFNQSQNCQIVRENNLNQTQSYAANITVENLILEAQKDAEKIRENAKNEAKRIEDEAKEKANIIILEAEQSKRLFVEDGERQKQSNIADGNIQRQKLIQEGESQRQKLIEEGEKRKLELIEDGENQKHQLIDNIAEQQYKDRLEERVKDHFKKEHLEERKIRENLDAEYNTIIKEKNDMLDGLNDGAQSLHSSLMGTLDDALSNLQNIQNNIHNQLNSWQRNLYKNELQGLAMCFMNLDKIITSMDNKIATHLSYKDEGVHQEIAGELSKSVKNLKILKSNFEASLARNSMKLLIPKVGESFNSNYHRAENMDPLTESEDSLNNKPIIAVSDAGIIRVLNSGDETIQRAVVTVQK